jgi:RNA polymerase sigma factor (sigma-70 family)
LADSRALLRAYLRLQVGSSSEVDDLEQDISVALWREAAAFDHTRSFTAWMLGFARIHVLRWRQQRARNRRVVALDDLSHDHLVWVGERIVAEGDPVDALTACLGQLDTASTRLLRQRYEDRLPLAAIAKQLRLSVATASRRLSRLVQVLDTCIRRRLDRPEDPAL